MNFFFKCLNGCKNVPNLCKLRLCWILLPQRFLSCSLGSPIVLCIFINIWAVCVLWIAIWGRIWVVEKCVVLDVNIIRIKILDIVVEPAESYIVAWLLHVFRDIESETIVSFTVFSEQAKCSCQGSIYVFSLTDDYCIVWKLDIGPEMFRSGDVKH